jgi:glycosyltransferase involved in cell wall biosynthesis
MLGVEEIIEFDDTYRSLDSLLELIDSVSCVVLPYDSVDQITSGVLVDALSARRPVIATAFPHAEELLAGDAGIVVPHRDPVSLATALRSVVTEEKRLEAMFEATADIARRHQWSVVATQYLEYGRQLVISNSAASL